VRKECIVATWRYFKGSGEGGKSEVERRKRKSIVVARFYKEAVELVSNIGPEWKYWSCLSDCSRFDIYQKQKRWYYWGQGFLATEDFYYLR
jgi:hypothetical protein